MIVPAEAPLETSPEAVHAMYVALNHPVVTLDGLPIGPAAAAIAQHEAGGATLVIRSTRARGVAFFHADAPAGRDPELAAATAFAHAEGLGFLFDDEHPLAGGAARDGWPAWLAEIFPLADAAENAVDPAAFLSKFRWALPAPECAAPPGAELSSR